MKGRKEGEERKGEPSCSWEGEEGEERGGGKEGGGGFPLFFCDFLLSQHALILMLVTELTLPSRLVASQWKCAGSATVRG
jgi:hypothetical protein